MTNRDDELAKARAQMNSAPLQAPEPYSEDHSMPHQSIPMQGSVRPQSQPMQATDNNDLLTAESMTVSDFLNAASAPQYVEKYWKSKGKKIQIKKFKKGELDKISAPLLNKTMKLDLNAAAAGVKNQSMNLDISMNIFNEMEKVMVELGMSIYKDGRGQPVINREYIDNVMPDEDFKELSDLIKEVNPKALMGNVDAAQETENAKK